MNARSETLERWGHLELETLMESTQDSRQMFCPSCGEEIPDDSATCSHCGEQIQQQAGGAGATGGPSLGALFAPETLIKTLAGLALLVGIMQFITYVDWMADALAWQGHIMFWGLFVGGGLLAAVGFVGDEAGPGEGFDFQVRLLAVLAALLVFALVGSATGGAIDMPSFNF